MPQHIVETMNIFDIINEDNTYFENHFLDSNRYYNRANMVSKQEITCIVYKDYPITTFNTIEYNISYDDFYTWMQNMKLIDFVEKA